MTTSEQIWQAQKKREAGYIKCLWLANVILGAIAFFLALALFAATETQRVFAP